MTTKARTAVSRADVTQPDLRLARIVRVLSHHSMFVVSGTKLASEISASRSEIWRLVQQLRSLGVEIAGHAATGYRLESVPDLLLPEAIAPLVQGTIFAGHIHHFFKTASTNVAAMQAAATGECEGAAFFAEEQAAGKGRAGHFWHSAPSTGLYCSIVLRPDLSPADALVISLAAGLAAAAAVEEITGLKPDLRWPNDLLLSRAASPDVAVRAPSQSGLTNADSAAGTGHSPVPTQASRKFCGVLTELNAEATSVRYVVVGIGINVNQESFPLEIADIATSLRIEGGRTYSRVELAAALLRALDREYRALIAGDLHHALVSIVRRFEQRSSYARGLRVRVEEEGGYTGITDGLDERGFLRVRTSESTRTVLHGGVRALTDADADRL